MKLRTHMICKKPTEWKIGSVVHWTLLPQLVLIERALIAQSCSRSLYSWNLQIAWHKAMKGCISAKILLGKILTSKMVSPCSLSLAFQTRLWKGAISWHRRGGSCFFVKYLSSIHYWHWVSKPWLFCLVQHRCPAVSASASVGGSSLCLLVKC